MTYRRRYRSMTVAGLLAALLATVPTIGQTGAEAAASADPTGTVGTVETWAADLSTIDGDDVNVTYRDGALRLANLIPGAAWRQLGVVEGVQVLAEHAVARPARELRAEVTADAGRGAVQIEVRGAQTNGWSDWHRLPADGLVFSREVSAVQVRIRLVLPVLVNGATGDVRAPVVTAVTLTAGPGN